MTVVRGRHIAGASDASARDVLARAASTSTESRLSRGAFERDFLEFEAARGRGEIGRERLNAFRNACECVREWGGNLYANFTSTRAERALDAFDEFLRHTRFVALEDATRAQFYAAICELREYWRAKAPSSVAARAGETATIDWDELATFELTGAEPIRIVFRGVELTGFYDWLSLYRRVVEEFVTRKLLLQKRVKQAKTGDILLGRASDVGEMTRPTRLGETDFWLATPSSGKAALRALVGFRKLSGVAPDELRIEYRRAGAVERSDETREEAFEELSPPSDLIADAPDDRAASVPSGAVEARTVERSPGSVETREVDFDNIPDMTGTKPTRLELFGREIVGWSDWRTLHLRLAERLIEMGRLKPYIGLCLRASSMVDFGDQRYLKKMTDPAPLKGTDYYMSTKRTETQTLRYVKYLLDYCGVLYNRVRLEYARVGAGRAEYELVDVKSARASGLSHREIVEKFCESRDGIFTLDELDKAVGGLPETISTILGWVATKAFRLSCGKFILKGKISFNVPATDAFLEKLCPGEYMSLKQIADAQRWRAFPRATTEWNEFLLASYLDGVSEKFALWTIGRRKREAVGAMVRKSIHFKSYDELLADALARSEAPFTNESAFEFFAQEKLLARRQLQTIDYVVSLAKEWRKHLEQ